MVSKTFVSSRYFILPKNSKTVNIVIYIKKEGRKIFIKKEDIY